MSVVVKVRAIAALEIEIHIYFETFKLTVPMGNESQKDRIELCFSLFYESSVVLT
jgi:hypothetical protein